MRSFFDVIFKKTQQISSVEEMTLTIRGMRGGRVYRLEGGELCRYREKSSGDLELEVKAACDLVSLMNTCGVLRWDGFHGKHPRGVLDGDMFDFRADVNGGVSIRANGSANFPKGYRELVRAFDEILRE